MGFSVARVRGSVDAEVICSICQDILEDPVQTQCEHAFCRACIETWLSTKLICPVDRDRVTTRKLRQPSRILKNILSRLEFTCDNVQHGCTEMIKYDALTTHKDKCMESLNQILTCQGGCGLDVVRRDVPTHNCVTELRAVVVSKAEKIDEITDQWQKVEDTVCSQTRLIVKLKDELIQMRSHTDEITSLKAGFRALNTKLQKMRTQAEKKAGEAEDLKIKLRSQEEETEYINMELQSSEEERASLEEEVAQLRSVKCKHMETIKSQSGQILRLKSYLNRAQSRKECVHKTIKGHMAKIQMELDCLNSMELEVVPILEEVDKVPLLEEEEETVIGPSNKRRKLSPGRPINSDRCSVTRGSAAIEVIDVTEDNSDTRVTQQSQGSSSGCSNKGKLPNYFNNTPMFPSDDFDEEEVLSDEEDVAEVC